MFWIFAGIASGNSNKYPKHFFFFKVLNTIFLHSLLLIVPLKQMFYDQTDIIMNFVIVSSVGIKRLVCTWKLLPPFIKGRQILQTGSYLSCT